MDESLCGLTKPAFEGGWAISPAVASTRQNCRLPSTSAHLCSFFAQTREAGAKAESSQDGMTGGDTKGGKRYVAIRRMWESEVEKRTGRKKNEEVRVGIEHQKRSTYKRVEELCVCLQTEKSCQDFFLT